MAPGRWQTDEQFDFLNANINAFLTASATSRFPKFWPDLTERWFLNWPEAQAQITLHNLPVDFVETVPDEEDSEATIANRAILKKAVESRQSQLKAWFRNHAKKKSKPLNATRLATVLLNRAKPTRRHQKTEIYETQYSEKVQEAVKVAYDAERAAAHDEEEKKKVIWLTVRRKVVKDLWDNETAAVKDEIDGLWKAQGEGTEGEGSHESPEVRTPEQYQEAIDNLPVALHTLGRELRHLTDYSLTIFCGGPNPRAGGQIEVISVHIGETPLGNSFATAYDMKNGIIAPYAEWLKRVYPLSVRKARALIPANADEAAANVESSDIPHTIFSSRNDGLLGEPLPAGAPNLPDISDPNLIRMAPGSPPLPEAPDKVKKTKKKKSKTVMPVAPSASPATGLPTPGSELTLGSTATSERTSPPDSQSAVSSISEAPAPQIPSAPQTTATQTTSAPQTTEVPRLDTASFAALLSMPTADLMQFGFDFGPVTPHALPHLPLFDFGNLRSPVGQSPADDLDSPLRPRAEPGPLFQTPPNTQIQDPWSFPSPTIQTRNGVPTAAPLEGLFYAPHAPHAPPFSPTAAATPVSPPAPSPTPLASALALAKPPTAAATPVSPPASSPTPLASALPLAKPKRGRKKQITTPVTSSEAQPPAQPRPRPRRVQPIKPTQPVPPDTPPPSSPTFSRKIPPLNRGPATSNEGPSVKKKPGWKGWALVPIDELETNGEAACTSSSSEVITGRRVPKRPRAADGTSAYAPTAQKKRVS